MASERPYEGRVRAEAERDAAFLQLHENLSTKGVTGPPSRGTYRHWEKFLSFQVYVNNIPMGEFLTLFYEVWADAYAKGVRDTRISGEKSPVNKPQS